MKEEKYETIKMTTLLLYCFVLINTVGLSTPMHITGKFNTGDFFMFLSRFGFQKTDLHDRENTQGYVYGNITSKDGPVSSISLVVVDSEYFLEFYGNRTVWQKEKACSSMFNKIDTVAWDSGCSAMQGKDKQDNLRKIPCEIGGLCEDEKPTADWVLPGYQFTYRVQDISQPRFWYVSLVSCYHNTTNSSHCEWTPRISDSYELEFDVWLVNGHPFQKHINPFEHQFSFEMHDVFEIYLVFFIAYCFLLPVQFYALSKQRHMLPFLLTTCMLLEFVGIIFNLIHVLFFAFDGTGVDLLKVVGNFIDTVAECLFMLVLLLIVKGWTITRAELKWKTKAILLTVWSAYTLASMGLFIWNLTEVDIISDKDEWQTWPGYIILAFRVAIMIWFLCELSWTFKKETNMEKNEFYLHFGAGFLVWFVYLPIVAFILTQISALWRFKTILSVTYSADFLSFCVMLHLLWPSRSKLYFNLSVRARLPMEELEFSGLMTSLSGTSSVGSNMSELSDASAITSAEPIESVDRHTDSIQELPIEPPPQQNGSTIPSAELIGANGYKGLAMTDNSDSDGSQELFDAGQIVKPVKSSQNGYAKLSQSDDFHSDEEHMTAKENASLLKTRSHSPSTQDHS